MIPVASIRKMSNQESRGKGLVEHLVPEEVGFQSDKERQCCKEINNCGFASADYDQIQRLWLPRNMSLRGNYKNFFNLIYDCFLVLCGKELEILCVTFWRVWCGRNSFVHERKSPDVAEAFNWSHGFLLDFQKKSPLSARLAVRNFVENFKWNPPEQGRLGEDNFWIEDFPQNVQKEVETDMLI
ncbi:hypothetical protein LWI29_024596 [Acer saccharum]|uniref:Uncharacterized protein n=1 Tax=Acer saccharum TaxID=4024 RepID=A0AA39RDM8_ACESA|nr:hypothetical protein LWI29_024596 [Acer saccharum]